MSNLGKFYAVNPVNNEFLDGEFVNATADQVDATVEKAIKAFDVYRKKDKDSIANFLERIGEEILSLGDALLERCHLETALPLARLQGERGRTIGQLNLFASVVREGSWVDARVETAIPNRAPLPKSDIRHMLLPLGPVAVFGASNFPLAFSVAGGDTVSALAAGCPVVVKAHPAHPGTSAMVASAIEKAINDCGMPEGVFSLVQGNTNEVGEALVKHSGIKAVGFTGSFKGGKALFDIANTRSEPIPVFAEMGSTNPVFILPDILKEKAEAIAAGMAGSITQGVGQFCTNPGLTFVQQSDAANKFVTDLVSKINEVPASTMLTAGINVAYDKKIKSTLEIDNVEEIATGKSVDSLNSAKARIFKASIETFSQNHALAEENFGPSSVIVEAQTKEQILDAARNLEGHLTATIHGTDADFAEFGELFDILELKVGRILINGYPTGVEVCHSMVHGGPYPATTASQTTSVGTNAIKRFARPICYQDYPDALLPNALRSGNPLNIWRMVNGNMEK
ncbi:aldehyde dehydrogenase (NADP(+)) [Flavobacterium sufflavum]|uniref:Aldehyde dehydrogenase (NADP(+)) n=1 Tax=Flavobacterium sufflavum TaxID=1921138 RepID=A0A437KR90_9FLAO|nr:aldehyde dehydrogenase (NADP(+)) [Flavobacterium sufflavum]RVT74406.1 aldehyde dehydrogenase (NADP(+)) [Flavobacterium sufflavum]